MPMDQPHSRSILHHNSKYSILICIECQYAIQKSALNSHLLKHKIYRGHREALLTSTAHLELLDPENVPTPAPYSAPVEYLPVMEGWKCTAVGCGNLCASSKRIRMHWSVAHPGREGLAFEEMAREVKMQTFFRGTKVKYFEVMNGTESQVRVADEKCAGTNTSSDRSRLASQSPRYSKSMPNPRKTLSNSPPSVDLDT